jgi:serine/threonine-protein kinase SRPK3
MLASFVKFLPQFGWTWKPLNFTNQNFVRIAANQKIEEEQFPEYAASRYYPVRIGEVFRDRYQVAGKLGFGASSTVWLAPDMRYDFRLRSYFMLTRFTVIVAMLHSKYT